MSENGLEHYDGAFRQLSVSDWVIVVLATLQAVKVLYKSRHPLLVWLRARIEVSGPAWLQELIECPWCLSVNVVPVILLLWMVSDHPHIYGWVADVAKLILYTLAVSQVVNLLYRKAWRFEHRGRFSEEGKINNVQKQGVTEAEVREVAGRTEEPDYGVGSCTGHGCYPRKAELTETIEEDTDHRG